MKRLSEHTRYALEIANEAITLYASGYLELSALLYDEMALMGISIGYENSAFLHEKLNKTCMAAVGNAKSANNVNIQREKCQQYTTRVIQLLTRQASNLGNLNSIRELAQEVASGRLGEAILLVLPTARGDNSTKHTHSYRKVSSTDTLSSLLNVPNRNNYDNGATNSGQNK